MFAGFDYGTSHCSIGVWTDGRVRLLPLEGVETQIPSTLFAAHGVDEENDGARTRIDLGDPTRLQFGHAALAAHLADPSDGYFVKSPKSFLGAPGLNIEVTERFISVVAAMMLNVKCNAESHLGRPIEQVIIGRPINFQRAGGDAENQQALSMLVAAARESGFEQVSFLYEPMAAALEYESRLDREMCILVVDVGGGTTDCSFVRVGPKRRLRKERDADILGHAGERLGGNDYDQMLALKTVMPGFGFNDLLRSGLPIPNTFYVDAVSTNDVNAQQRFYSARAGEELRRFVREAHHPERIARLNTVHEARLSYRLLRASEETKIVLTDQSMASTELGFVEQGLTAPATRDELRVASERLLTHLAGLVDETVRAAGQKPDILYLTGGMSRSQIVRAHLRELLPGIEIVDSDHLASVTQGLTVWAHRVFGAD
jgi:hypothetical chaperone protein